MESASVHVVRAALLGATGAVLTALFLFDVEHVNAVFSTAVLLGVPASCISLLWKAGPGRNAAKIRRLRTLDVYRYRAANPRAVRAGALACKHCGSHHIYSRRAIKGTWLREHYCDSCGESLYYSEERRAA